MKKLLLATAAVLCAAVPAAAETVNGSGSAAITPDVETVRVTAEREAKRELVRQMVVQALGAERLREVPPSTIEALAGQIRPDMITDRSAHRDGQMYVVDLQGDIDGDWFRSQLDTYGIQSSSDRASGGQLILVMLDQSEGVAADFAKPAEVSVEYDHRQGGSYSDRSAAATSERSASASSSKSAMGFTERQAEASGVSTPYGSAAGKYRGSASGAAASKSASASVYKYDHASRANVQAEVHDDVRFREHVVYQKPPANSPGQYALTALAGVLTDYGLNLADPSEPLATFFHGRPPRFAALETQSSFRPFLNDLAAHRNAPFFMGGEITIEHDGTDAATGRNKCSGGLSARAFATGDSQIIGTGDAHASATGETPGDCANNLARSLARSAAAEIGPRVQRYWRHAGQANAGLNTSEVAN